MEIDAAIQQYLIHHKEEARRDRVEFDLAVLARLQEYLEGEPSLERAEAIQAADLRAYIIDWIRSGEEVTPVAAERVVAAVVGFAAWLDRQFASVSPSSTLNDLSGFRSSRTETRDPIAPLLASLEEELPRAARIAQSLIRHAHREDLSEPIRIEEMPGDSPLGTISAGVNRVIRPSEIDYGRAEEDTFRVVEVSERSVGLQSPAREQLNEGPAAPVAVPARAARLLRVGDILHVEIAPAGAGWEILHVETVIPGGLDDRL